nr:hypothetical protein [Actinomycetales bacterium]
MARGRWGAPLEDPANQYSPTYHYGVLRPSTRQSSLPTSPNAESSGGGGWQRALDSFGLAYASDRSAAQAFHQSLEAASAGQRNPYSTTTSSPAVRNSPQRSAQAGPRRGSVGRHPDQR